MCASGLLPRQDVRGHLVRIPTSRQVGNRCKVSLVLVLLGVRVEMTRPKKGFATLVQTPCSCGGPIFTQASNRNGSGCFSMGSGRWLVDVEGVRQSPDTCGGQVPEVPHVLDRVGNGWPDGSVCETAVVTEGRRTRGLHGFSQNRRSSFIC